VIKRHIITYLLGRAWASPSIVRNGTCIKFTKKFWTKTVYSTLLQTDIPFAKLYWKNTVYPSLLLNCTYIVDTKVYWFAPHCCWMVRTSWILKFTEEYGLPHTVARWYVRREHWSLLKNTVCPTLLLDGTYVTNTEVWIRFCPTLLLNGMYVANTEVYWRIWLSPHCCWMVRTSQTLKFTEEYSFAPHCSWMVRNWSMHW